MATYTLTEASITRTDITGAESIAGEALAVGDIVYVDPVDQKVYKAVNNVSIDKANAKGICLNKSVAAGQPVKYLTTGDQAVGAVFSGAGKVMALSSNAGKMCDVGDVTAGQRLTLIGVTLNSSTIRLLLNQNIVVVS